MNTRCAVVVLLLAACTPAPRNVVSDPSGRLDSGQLDASTHADASSTRLDASAPGAPDASAALDGSARQDADADAASARCDKHVCSCDDGIDNDDDGLVDGLDPECTGAYDDDEASFATGQPNKLMACRDCFWDDNSGSGDDSCRYPFECLTDPGFVGKSNCPGCSVTETCESNCALRTPNGCDCFGCCEVLDAQGLGVYVQLLESCSLAALDDTQSCPRCTPHPTCKNDCGRCELCLGKRQADLPPDCAAAAGPGYECEDGLAVCSRTSPCAPGYYCHQGCCLVDLL